VALGVLADDLTGALASAARLREARWEPVVVWRETTPPASADAVVVDMRTRDYGGDPYRRARWWARRLDALGCGWLELRMDSTLRGAPATELAGLLGGAGPDPRPVLAVPAFPAAGRTVVGGRLRAPVPLPGGDDDVGRVLFGPQATVDLLDLDLVGQGAPAVATAIHALAGEGSHHLLADAASEEDLGVLADAARRCVAAGVNLHTVSPGAWLRYLRPAPRPRYVLVVLSSNTPTNHDQLAALSATRPTVVLPARDVVAGRRTAFPDGDPTTDTTVVVETISHAAGDPTEAWLLSMLAAHAAARVLEDGLTRGLGCAALVMGGGQTASSVMDVLGATHLVGGPELAPLCPRATVAGGTWAGLAVVTKGGLVGGPDTLSLIVDTLWKESP
jgi:uncharacterized protein YgbK (DUF1537 family)